MAAIRRSFELHQDLLPVLIAGGVAVGVLVQVLNRADETAELLEAAAGYPSIAGVVGWVDLMLPDVGDQLSVAAQHGPPVGVRHQLQA